MGGNWQKIIWREWRRCNDPDYAGHLFELVADELAGWGARLSAILLNLVGGAALALVGGAILTFDWAVLQYFAWAGGFIGGLRGYLLSREMSWRIWLDRLSANTPTSNFSRVIFSALFLGSMGRTICGSPPSCQAGPRGGGPAPAYCRKGGLPTAADGSMAPARD